MLLYYFILLGPIYIGDPGSHTSHSSAYKSTYYRSWNSAIFIHQLHWIFCAEGVRRYAIVLLRKRILSEPAAEDRVVLTGAVVDVRSSKLELLLLAVILFIIPLFRILHAADGCAGEEAGEGHADFFVGCVVCWHHVVVLNVLEASVSVCRVLVV